MTRDNIEDLMAVEIRLCRGPGGTWQARIMILPGTISEFVLEGPVCDTAGEAVTNRGDVIDTFTAMSLEQMVAWRGMYMPGNGDDAHQLAMAVLAAER